MVRRTALSISALALAAALLLNFQGPGQASTLVIGTAGSGSSVSSGTSSGTTSGTSSGSSGSTATATAGPATGTATYTGNLVSTQFGDVQVQITVTDGAITDVQALALPVGGHSGQISNIVAPMLRNEALAAQSASIDVISGATYTSRGYATSLQAALDAAGL
jgi:uncharacterized protein with FMN-binding domain